MEWGKSTNCNDATARQSCQDDPANAKQQQTIRSEKNQKRFWRNASGDDESSEAEVLRRDASACKLLL